MRLITILLLVGVVVVTAKRKGDTVNHRSTKSSTASPLECLITLECELSKEVGVMPKRHFECSPVENGVVSDYSYDISLPKAFAERHHSNIVAGSNFCTIPGGRIVNDTVYIPTNSNLTVIPAPDLSDSIRRRQRRRQLSASGTRSILMLRITALDATVYFSTSDLYSYTFDNSDPTNRPSLSSQYNATSFGKLNYVPALNGVGVVDVSVNLNASGGSTTAMRDEAIAVVTTRYGVSSITELADHVMICLPPGTGDWASSATVNSWRTVYNDMWCGFLSALMHEFGHNLGLLHANVGANAYLDFTSYMSAGFGVQYYPSKAFNGANNWQLGWYSDRQITIDPSKGQRFVTLATFVDYGKVNKTFPVIIQVGNSTFVQYNREKGFNSQVQQCIDQVTIVQQFFNGTGRLGCLDLSRPQLNIDNFDGSGQSLAIYVCRKGDGNDNDPDWMQLSIGYGVPNCDPTINTPNPTVVTPKPSSPPSIHPSSVFLQQIPTDPPQQRPTIKPAVSSPALPTATSTKQPTLPDNVPKQPTKTPSKPLTRKPTTRPAQPPLASMKPTFKRGSLTFTPSTKPIPASTLPPSRSPPVASPPSQQPARVTCYDSTSAKIVIEGINRTCAWLRVRQSWQRQLCPQETFQLACPRTCNFCNSTCVDHPGNFLYGHVNRTCQWLSARASAVKACALADVSSLCPVTCQSCS